jgi:hypothetical protein
MHSKGIVTLIAVAAAICVSSCHAPQQQIAKAQAYSLVVNFQGLIAFVQTQRNGKPVLWALLPNANYEPSSPQEEDLPPCVSTEVADDVGTLVDQFPPHLAALRIKNATLNGAPVTDYVFIIQGNDLRFATGTTIQSIAPLKLAAMSQHLVNTLHGKPSDYLPLDKVHPDYLTEDSSKVVKLPFFAARVLIDFGYKITENPLSCRGTTIAYGFQAPPDDQNNCSADFTSLAEGITVNQDGISNPIQISLLPSGNILTIGPDGSGKPVTIDVLNSIPSAIADPNYDSCQDVHQHEQSFRWYYRLLAKQTSAADCSDNFFPCEPERVGGNQGGSKCPEKGLAP